MRITGRKGKPRVSLSWNRSFFTLPPWSFGEFLEEFWRRFPDRVPCPENSEIMKVPAVLWKGRGMDPHWWSLRGHHPASDSQASNPVSTTPARTVWLWNRKLNFSENQLLHLQPEETTSFPPRVMIHANCTEMPVNVAVSVVYRWDVLDLVRFGKVDPECDSLYLLKKCVLRTKSGTRGSHCISRR